MNAALREMVRRRAADRCEYCRIPQSAIPDVRFHVEHIVARQHGGGDDTGNLALACDRCNCYKGTNLTAVDPQADTIVPLFNPRTNDWFGRFTQSDFDIVGLTTVGRATAQLLRMNDGRRVQLRAALRVNLLVD